MQNLIRIRGNWTVACVKLTLANAGGDRVRWPRAEFVANHLFPAGHQLARGNDHAAVDGHTAPSPLLLHAPWLSARPRTPLLAYKLRGSAHEKVQTVRPFLEYGKMFKIITPRYVLSLLSCVTNHSFNQSVIWKWHFLCSGIGHFGPSIYYIVQIWGPERQPPDMIIVKNSTTAISR